MPLHKATTRKLGSSPIFCGDGGCRSRIEPFYRQIMVMAASFSMRSQRWPAVQPCAATTNWPLQVTAPVAVELHTRPSRWPKHERPDRPIGWACPEGGPLGQGPGPESAAPSVVAASRLESGAVLASSSALESPPASRRGARGDLAASHAYTMSAVTPYLIV